MVETPWPAAGVPVGPDRERVDPETIEDERAGDCRNGNYRDGGEDHAGERIPGERRHRDVPRRSRRSPSGTGSDVDLVVGDVEIGDVLGAAGLVVAEHTRRLIFADPA